MKVVNLLSLSILTLVLLAGCNTYRPCGACWDGYTESSRCGACEGYRYTEQYSSCAYCGKRDMVQKQYYGAG